MKGDIFKHVCEAKVTHQRIVLAQGGGTAMVEEYAMITKVELLKLLKFQ